MLWPAVRAYQWNSELQQQDNAAVYKPENDPERVLKQGHALWDSDGNFFFPLVLFLEPSQAQRGR